MRQRFTEVLALVLGAQACLLTSPLIGDNRFFLSESTAPEGATGQTFYVHCEHDVTARAYSLGIRYDAKVIRVTSISHEGTSAENPDFWGDTSREGEIALGVVLDTTSPLTRYLAPASDHTLARITFDAIGKAGATSPLEFVDNVGQFHPVDNVLTDDRGRDVILELTDGSVRIVPAADVNPIANAGPDQVVAEVSRVVLDASRSQSPDGHALQFAWRQTGGPPVQELTGQNTPQVSFTVPPVGSDSEITFELVVSEGGGNPKTGKDEAKVFAIDLDQRKGGLLAVPGDAQVIDGGARALLFQGDISWSSQLEDGFWTRMRFTPSGAGDESRLLGGTSLFWDSNRSGVFDSGDEKLGGTETVAADGDPVEFTFYELLRNGDTRRLFLVADLQQSRNAQALLLPVAVLAAAGLCSRRRGRYSARAALARGILVALLAALALGPAACGGGGGGGGGGGQPAVSREVRFDIASPTDVGLQGTETGVAVGASGVPVQGPALTVR